jgi:hypothetical protein
VRGHRRPDARQPRLVATPPLPAAPGAARLLPADDGPLRRGRAAAHHRRQPERRRPLVRLPVPHQLRAPHRQLGAVPAADQGHPHQGRPRRPGRRRRHEHLAHQPGQAVVPRRAPHGPGHVPVVRHRRQGQARQAAGHRRGPPAGHGHHRPGEPLRGAGRAEGVLRPRRGRGEVLPVPARPAAAGGHPQGRAGHRRPVHVVVPRAGVRLGRVDHHAGLRRRRVPAGAGAGRGAVAEGARRACPTSARWCRSSTRTA